jgi:hypothetical protein
MEQHYEKGLLTKEELEADIKAAELMKEKASQKPYDEAELVKI